MRPCQVRAMSDLVSMMPRYEAYKDSGVEWIGKIPVHWEILRLKNLAHLNPSLSAKDKKQNQIAIFLPMEKVSSDGKVDFSNKKYSHDLINGFTHFKKNDIIVAKITPCFENKKGACLNNMPTLLGFGSTEFHVLRKKSCSDSKFIYYLTKSHLFMNLGERLMTGSAGQKRVPSEFVNTFPVAAPSLLEQKTIANFLDCKTAKIDQAVAIKEQQIQLLKERKQILIQTAVTKGLDPDVPMRDSGVEWIGEIPEHWQAKRLKYLFTEYNKRTETGSETLFSLRMEKGLIPHNDVSDKHIADENLINYKVVNPGQLVMNRMRAAIGIFGLAHNYGLVSPDYSVFNIYHQVCADYYLLMFKTSLLGTQFRLNSRGMGTGSSGFMRLYTENFGDIKIPYPSLDEQKIIVNHIQIQSDKIDKTIAIQKQMIDKLKEYKATLINSAVTGKIKVPQIVEAKAVE